MANLPETTTYDAGVYQLETTDLVMGGVNGEDNKAAKNLANRTNYLKSRVDLMETIVPQAEAEARTATTLRGWTAQRVGQAIAAGITALVVQATETVKGIAEIATQAEANTGTDNTRIITPLRLSYGLTLSLTANGYIKFPDWVGGLVIQWGIWQAGGTTGFPHAFFFPIAFPNNAFSVAALPGSIPEALNSENAAWSDTVAQTGFNGHAITPLSYIRYIAIGN